MTDSSALAENAPPSKSKGPFYLVFAGILTGIANVIPGVSGGTMAFIMGIYQDLLDAINAFDFKLLQLLQRRQFRAAFNKIPWRFLLPFGIGLALAVLLFAGIITWLLAHQTVLIYAFFFGLVAASIISISIQVRWSLQAVVTFLIGAVLAWWLVGLVPQTMPNTPLILFFSGAAAIIAMILPGISGSFLLLILGQYAYVMGAIAAFKFTALVPFAAGLAVGLLAFTHVLSWLLKHYYQPTITLLTGFMAGSLRKIWPFKRTLETMLDRHGAVVPIREANILPDVSTLLFWEAVGFCVLGLVALSILDHMQTRANPLVLMCLPRARSKT